MIHKLLRVCLLALGANLAFGAILTDVGVVDQSGTGFGNFSTILAIQNTGSEVGCVGYDGSADVIGAGCVAGFSGGNEQPNQTATVAISDLNFSFADLRVIFNINEPQNDNGTVTLNDLRLFIFDPTGAVVFTSDALTPEQFVGFTGQGTSGVVFQLTGTPQDLAAAQASFVSGNRLGLFANIGDTAGGAESFRIGSVVSDPGDPTGIPEPGTLLLLGAGLSAVGLLRRKS